MLLNEPTTNSVQPKTTALLKNVTNKYQIAKVETITNPGKENKKKKNGKSSKNENTYSEFFSFLFIRLNGPTVLSITYM
jgi:hypothetical protein